ncbi:hypothetical protein AVEN_147836-1 [Araneus ventricosus]|uniref:Uncharacterized protein n=1 Tax=Araneus ventricosus TaxID=182803 RepID=A0A4Y2CSJ1_ARAVE|nr:hypothetical protein AVEN_147836-1 [Araneus ventricosus]
MNLLLRRPERGEETSHDEAESIQNTSLSYYEITFEYLALWSKNCVKDLEVYWARVKETPEWKDVEINNASALPETNVVIQCDENGLYKY